MERYSIIEDKRRREIVLLRGRGCAYGKCAFCDYYADSSKNDDENYALNAEVLSRVTGECGEIEIINSGSVFELDARTHELIKSVCKARGISVIHFEAHYMYKDKIPALRREYSDFTLKMRIGVETFDHDFRERVLLKGIPERYPKKTAEQFDEANLLFGLTGQTAESMTADVELCLALFERVYVNIMCENTTRVKPDAEVIKEFMREVYPRYKDDPRVDILLQNTDFGVGE